MLAPAGRKRKRKRKGELTSSVQHDSGRVEVLAGSVKALAATISIADKHDLASLGQRVAATLAAAEEWRVRSPRLLVQRRGGEGGDSTCHRR